MNGSKKDLMYHKYFFQPAFINTMCLILATTILIILAGIFFNNPKFLEHFSLSYFLKVHVPCIIAICECSLSTLRCTKNDLALCPRPLGDKL